jgi:hypothetical protein
MSLVDVSVAQYELWVDGAETVRAVLESADIDAGGPLAEALELATSGSDVFAVAPSDRVQAADFLPGAADGGGVIVSADTVDGVLSSLAKAGYLSGVHVVWSETASQAYLSTGRELLAVRVLRPFALVAVTYSWSGASRVGPAERCEVTDRSRPVEPGWYVVGTVGDFGASRLVGVAGVDVGGCTDPQEAAERLTYWAVEVEGFGASRCLAGCESCGGRWYAECGSWHFTAEDDAASTVDGWDFDDAADFDERGTVACPACQSGRVGFLIC